MKPMVEELVQDEYADSFTLTRKDMEIYDIDATLENVIEKIRELKIARNKYINGYHSRLTPSYRPMMEQFTLKKSDPVGDEVEFNLDSEQAYNIFNEQLDKLYSIMSKEENAYINDCLILGYSDASIKLKLNIERRRFEVIRDSAIIRFGIVFNIVVYK